MDTIRKDYIDYNGNINNNNNNSVNDLHKIIC